jgi:hypothetical protein
LVTVTHGIDRKARPHRELNLPTLEIDIGSLGGRSPGRLRHLVMSKPSASAGFITRPAVPSPDLAELDQHPVTVRFQALGRIAASHCSRRQHRNGP